MRKQLEERGLAVERQRGVDRYATAVGIAKRVARELSKRCKADGYTWKKNINVYLATGTNFPDAMAAGAAAADNDGVVLLTKGSKMSASTLKFLRQEWKLIPEYGNDIQIHTVGRDAELAAGSSIEDVYDTNTGRDRYETAVMLASKFHHKIHKVAVASGESFADGSFAGAWIANHDGPLVLTANASLPKVVSSYLFTLRRRAHRHRGCRWAGVRVPQRQRADRRPVRALTLALRPWGDDQQGDCVDRWKGKAVSGARVVGREAR